jgi:hypothetical protein
MFAVAGRISPLWERATLTPNPNNLSAHQAPPRPRPVIPAELQCPPGQVARRVPGGNVPQCFPEYVPAEFLRCPFGEVAEWPKGEKHPRCVPAHSPYVPGKFPSPPPPPGTPPRRPLSSIAHFDDGRHLNPHHGFCCESCAHGGPCEGGCGASCTCGKEAPRQPNGWGLMHAARMHNPRWNLASR